MSRLHALVTGASSGIGEEFARQLSRRGYRVTLVARREERLREVLAQLDGEGHHYLAADLGATRDVARVGAYLDAQRCNLLVNNAGYSVLEPFYASELSRQLDILAVDCGALVTLAHHFLRQAESGDALVNLASVVSFLPTPAQPVYSASKAFVASFSECLWEEHRGRGVYVMGLCPGVTQTDFIATATGGESDGQTMPDVFIQTTAQVVEEALAALGKRYKPIVVTGVVNRLMVALMPRLLSRFRLLKTMAVIGDPERAL